MIKTKTLKKEEKKEEHREEPLRWAALGGLEEVGRNMTFFEYRNEIIIVDVGFQFPEEETPGIDYIIPNVAYLEERKQNIKAIIVTHAHYDHIGGIPYLMEKLGNPPMYAAALTKEIINKRQEEFPKAAKLNFQIIKDKDKVELSKYFSAEFFGVAHNIPDTLGFVLNTPIGKMAYIGDYKFDYDKEGQPKGLAELKKIGEQKIHTLFLESTNAEEPGYSLSERVVEKNLEEIFKNSPGRIIIALFASLINRVDEILKIADRLDRKVAISGYSMQTNIQIAQNLGYIKARKGLIIPLEDVKKHPDNKVMILSTGAQGEANASLIRIINGEHRFISLKATDTVLLSASVVPGNERGVQLLKDGISRQGAKVFYSKIIDIHSSGHAPQEELKLTTKLINPKFFIPIYGYIFMRAINNELAHKIGIPEKNTFLPSNGQVMEFSPTHAQLTKEEVPVSYVMVDGLGIGDVGEVVLRDRKVLAQEGMVVIITTIDRRTSQLVKNPDIISRGFIYLRENQSLLDEIRRHIRGMIGRLPRYQPLDADYFKSLIRDQIGQFLYNKTKRRPMILPVVIEV
ncbi:MAG: ribonuclease J [Candidatus Paceibacterota bacterium]